MVSWSDILPLIPVPGPSGSIISKLRVTSVVVEPCLTNGINPGVVTTPDFIGLLSGNHYAAPSNGVALRMRFSNKQGSDGEWKKQTGTAANPSYIDGYGRVIDTAQFARLVLDSPAGGAYDLRLRIAYTDSSATG